LLQSYYTSATDTVFNKQLNAIRLEEKKQGNAFKHPKPNKPFLIKKYPPFTAASFFFDVIIIYVKPNPV